MEINWNEESFDIEVYDYNNNLIPKFCKKGIIGLNKASKMGSQIIDSEGV